MSLWPWFEDERPWQKDGLELSKRVRWGLGAFFLIPFTIFVAMMFLTSEEELDADDYAEIAALEDELRPRGAVEDALSRYEATMQQIADELSAQQPGLTWRWNPQVGSVKCSGDFEDTVGVQLRRRLEAGQPIPGERWAAAHQIVRDKASEIGVSYVNGVALPGGVGGVIDLTQHDAAVLSGVTPCQLRRAQLDPAG